MDFTHRIDTNLAYDDAVARVTEALAEQGFGVLSEIDIRQTLQNKIGVDTAPQIILGACNPQLAHRALQAGPRIAALLPCNVVVRVADGRTVVEALDPALMAEVSGDENIRPVATEATDRIRAALDAVASAD